MPANEGSVNVVVDGVRIYVGCEFMYYVCRYLFNSFPKTRLKNSEAKHTWIQNTCAPSILHYPSSFIFLGGSVSVRCAGRQVRYKTMAPSIILRDETGVSVADGEFTAVFSGAALGNDVDLTGLAEDVPVIIW